MAATFVVDGGRILVCVLCFLLCCFVFCVENRVSVGLAFLVSCCPFDAKKTSFFFLIAFVSHIQNIETRPNGIETECNWSVWRPFLTSWFRCLKIKTEISGSVQKLCSKPTDSNWLHPYYKIFMYLYIECKFWKFNRWSECYYYIIHSCLENSKKINDQLLCHKKNVKISSFCNLKLCIKNKFIYWIVNNIWSEWNLICMLRTYRTKNLMVIFSYFTPKNELHEKFEDFFSKLVWRETLFIYIYIYI